MAAAVDFTNFEKECGLSLADETRQSLRLMKSKIYSEFLVTAIKSVGDRCQNIMTLKFSTTSSSKLSRTFALIRRPAKHDVKARSFHLCKWSSRKFTSFLGLCIHILIIHSLVCIENLIDVQFQYSNFNLNEFEE